MPTPERVTLNRAAIKRVLLAAGRSQREIARAAEMGESELSAIVCGARRPRVEVANKIAAALGVDLAAIVEAPTAERAA